MTVNGQQIINTWTGQAANEVASTTIALTAGTKYVPLLFLFYVLFLLFLFVGFI